VGILSARFTPPFEGADSFKGLSLHTGTWPKELYCLRGNAWPLSARDRRRCRSLLRSPGKSPI
jgi:hypothetical protein